MSSSDSSDGYDGPGGCHHLTGEERESYLARRLPALADPLEKDTILDWSGPNLRPSTLPPTNYPHNSPPDATPNPPRPLLSSLLSASSPSQGGVGWALRLVEPLEDGVDKWSQVWRCEVVPPQLSEGPPETVVLKLRQQYYEWTSARQLIRNEARAYRCVFFFPFFLLSMLINSLPHSRLQGFQGRDVPLCYGVFTFVLPCAEKVVGVVLEDLTTLRTISLSDFLTRELAGNRLSMENVDLLVRCLSFPIHQKHAGLTALSARRRRSFSNSNSASRIAALLTPASIPPT
jgi:hypothetical protein